MSKTPPRYNSSESLPDFTSDGFLGKTSSDARDTVREIVRDVHDRGWEAVLEFSDTFDNHLPDETPLDRGELDRAWQNCSSSTREAFRKVESRIRRYQAAIRPGSSVITDNGNGMLGEIWRPIQTVGCYIPGGRFPLPSTVFMTAYIAEIAGVEELVVCSPPDQETGKPNAAILAALSRLESVNVHTIGGAQAVAAMAFGTGPVKGVDLIAGPGNLYVTLAKKEVFGQVGVDLLAGPSEITVIATPESSNPEWVAADLLSQAEHDPSARAFLLTPEETFLEDVREHLDQFLQDHPNQDSVRESLRNSGLILTEDVDEAIEISNRIAPEHLELHLPDHKRRVKECRNAGAIFCGFYAPEPIGDYVAGPSHTLPTRGGARFFSPLSVRTFMKSQSLIATDQSGMEEQGEYGETFADIESLWAHGKSLSLRNNHGGTPSGD